MSTDVGTFTHKENALCGAEAGAAGFQRILLVDLHCPAADWAAAGIEKLYRGQRGSLLVCRDKELADRRFPGRPALVRTQGFNLELATQADRIVFAFRDVRDALASLDQYVKVAPTAALANKLIASAKAWEHWATLSLRHETVCAEPKATLAEIARHLGLEAKISDSLLKQIDPLLKPSQGEVGCVHAGIGTYAKRLPDAVLHAIEVTHGEWLRRHGYTCAADPAPAKPLTVVQGFEGDQKLLKLLSDVGFRPRVILDVGASNGPWSFTCAQVFPYAIYYLGEPLPNYRSNLMVPNDGKQWHYMNLALGPDDRELQMTVPDEKFGTYGSTALEFNREVKGDVVSVAQRSVNSLLAEGKMRVPDLMKIDVQGYELHVMEGADQLWGKTEIFILETSLYQFWENGPSLLDVMNYFDRRGYTLFDFAGEFRSSRNGTLQQADLVFVNKKGALVRQLGSKTFDR